MDLIGDGEDDGVWETKEEIQETSGSSPRHESSILCRESARHQFVPFVNKSSSGLVEEVLDWVESMTIEESRNEGRDKPSEWPHVMNELNVMVVSCLLQHFILLTYLKKIIK